MNLFKVAASFLIIFFPLIRTETWHNWGNNQVCSPEHIFYPHTLDEVQTIIKKAIDNKKKVKIIGSSHSWSDLINTDGYLINTDNFNKIISIDYDRLQVTTQAGIKLKHLTKELAIAGLSLSNQGFIAEQTIAGAIATATHGTGKKYNLSDYIVALQIIDGTGTIHTVSPEHNGHWLPLLRVGLGAFGFIYSVTIQCERLFKLKHSRIIDKLANIIDTYEQLYNTHDYFMLMFKPESDQTLVFTWNQTNDPVNVNRFHYLFNDIIFNRFLNSIAVNSFNRFPAIAPFFVKNALKNLCMKEHVDYSYKTLSPIKGALGTHWYIEEEVAIPFEYFPMAISKLLEFYRSYANRELISFITCRFGPATEHSYLSPCYGRKTAYITINILNYFEKYEEFFHDFEKTMAPFDARPHWGKFHYLTKEKINELYGQEKIMMFNNLRSLLDPHSLFANNFIQRCFG